MHIKSHRSVAARKPHPPAEDHEEEEYEDIPDDAQAQQQSTQEEAIRAFRESLDQLYNEATYHSTNHTWPGFHMLRISLYRLTQYLQRQEPPSLTGPTEPIVFTIRDQQQAAPNHTNTINSLRSTARTSYTGAKYTSNSSIQRSTASSSARAYGYRHQHQRKAYR